MDIQGLLPTVNFILTSGSDDDLISAPPKATMATRTPDYQSPQTVVSLLRGRGRPPKNGVSGINKFPAIVEPRGRGRPPKRGRGKVAQPIVPTGKGRGRPKKSTLTDSDDESDDSSDYYSVPQHQTPPTRQQIVTAKAKPGKRRGRPKKIKNSDDDSDEDYERQPVGRPATGAINLNIERTGRGQGRPKKDVRLPRSNICYSGTNDNDNDNVVDSGILLLPKKRGRPSKGATAAAPRVSSGRPRGRPKTKVVHVQSSESDDDYDMATDKVVSDENSDDDNDSSHNVVSDLVVKI